MLTAETEPTALSAKGAFPQMARSNHRGGRLWGGVNLTGTAGFGNRPAQITGTEAEPQQIVAQGLLSCLQYHVP